MKLRWFAFLIVLLAGCSSKHDVHEPAVERESSGATCDAVDANKPESRCSLGRRSTIHYGDYRYRIGGNPNAVSKSNAIGLMQLKLQPPDVMYIAVWAGVVSRRPAS